MSAPKFLQRPTIPVTALVLVAIVTAFLANRKAETLPQNKPYSVGDTAKQEVVAPKKLAVVDPAETEIRRQKETEKIPVVFRFQKTIPDQVVANFSTDFVFTREKFLDVVEKNFKSRVLTASQIGLPRFRKMFLSFQSVNKSYAVTLSEAKKWASGDLEEPLFKDLCAKLQKTSEGYIRVDHLLPSNQIIGFQIRIYSGKEAAPSLGNLKQNSQILRRTNLVALTKARGELLAGFPQENRAIGKILTNYVQPNCIFEPDLTAQLRAEKTNGIWAVVSYEPGQVIVRNGEIIDAKTKAALDELKIEMPIATANVTNSKQNWLWGIAISCVVLATIFLSFGLAVRSRMALSPVQNVLVLPRTDISNNEIHAKLIPHLARGLMNKLVRGLISQRSESINAQNAGSDQLADLEQRLDQINSRLKNRQTAYELRIAELEKELAAAEEENRELIRAKIHEARQNLEWAKAQANQQS